MSRLAHTALFACALAGSTLAQGRHVFELNQAGSAFTFSGSVTLAGVTGPIVGTPNNFNVSGDAAVDVTVAGGAITQGNLVDGNGAIVDVPALSAELPNPIPFLPALATINVTASEVVFTSTAPFAVGPGGNFNATVSAMILSGSVNVTGLVNVTVPLAGQVSNQTAVAGTLTPSGNGMDLLVPINTTFSFADAASGATGTLTIVGNVVAEDRSFAEDVDTISLTTGGVQTMTLSAGTANTGLQYITLGTTSGTAPGFDANGVNIPLNADGWTIQTASAPNTFPLGGSLGVIDAVGNGTTTLTFPPLPIPILVGLQFHHAYAVLDGGGSVTFASNPVPMTFTP